MSKALDLATLVTSDFATNTDVTDAIGNITVDDNTPNFRVDLRGNQAISTGVETTIPFGNEVFDTADGWDGTTYKYTIPETGKWFISNVVRVSGGGNNTVSTGDINLYKNSDILAHVGLTPNTSGAVGIYAGSTAGIYDLTQGDEIYVKTHVIASAPRIDGRSDGGFTHLSGFKLAA